MGGLQKNFDTNLGPGFPRWNAGAFSLPMRTGTELLGNERKASIEAGTAGWMPWGETYAGRERQMALPVRSAPTGGLGGYSSP